MANILKTGKDYISPVLERLGMSSKKVKDAYMVVTNVNDDFINKILTYEIHIFDSASAKNGKKVPHEIMKLMAGAFRIEGAEYDTEFPNKDTSRIAGCYTHAITKNYVDSTNWKSDE